MRYGGFLEYLTKRVKWEAVGMAWANTIVPVCPRCGMAGAYHVSTRDKFKCRSCGHNFSRMSATRFSSNKLPAETIAKIAEATLAGESGPRIAKRFGVQVNTVYKIRDKAKD